MSKKRLLTVFIIAAFLVLSTLGVRKWMYPFGVRHALLPSVRAGMLAYAADNQGWFPVARTDNYSALSALYPKYCSPTELAGVSGDPGEAARELQQRGKLSTNATSWVYFAGLRDDDPKELALLWERRTGLYWNGKRSSSGSRVVLFADGSISNIAGKHWDSFFRQQQELLRLVGGGRTNSLERSRAE